MLGPAAPVGQESLELPLRRQGGVSPLIFHRPLRQAFHLPGSDHLLARLLSAPEGHFGVDASPGLCPYPLPAHSARPGRLPIRYYLGRFFQKSASEPTRRSGLIESASQACPGQEREPCPGVVSTASPRLALSGRRSFFTGEPSLRLSKCCRLLFPARRPLRLSVGYNLCPAVEAGLPDFLLLGSRGMMGGPELTGYGLFVQRRGS